MTTRRHFTARPSAVAAMGAQVRLDNECWRAPVGRTGFTAES